MCKELAPKDHFSAEVKEFTSEQAEPTKGTSPAIWDLVITDMQSRDKIGMERYGDRLRADNGRDPLIDAYQELLDGAVYLRSELYKRYGK